MPTFKGLISEEGMLKLVEYVRSLGPSSGTPTGAAPGAVQTSGSEPQTPAQRRVSGQATTVPTGR
jgi:hypothetical protein